MPHSPAAIARALGSALESETGSRETVGTLIGAYKLLQEIGQGGFGTVWMAEQQEPIRRRVALKIVKAGLETDEVIARFEAERQALALMNHPNIARVFDAGATATGRPYFVMELVRGIAITRYCDENRLSAEARLRLFLPICDAVQHAHHKGVIHRDLKPSNILVTLHDDVPVPMVIDFGIAKATDKRLTEKTLVTQFHTFIGTPVYTSPEQMEMSGLDVDTRSDIYSLGVLLYELLAGRPPFDADALLKSGLDAMRRTIREVDPPRPSARLRTLSDDDRTTVAGRRSTDPVKLSVLLRGDLDWIVMRCLEKDRTRRYQTANDLASDVLHHLRDEPVVARPPSTGYRFRKLIRRNRLASTALAIFAVLLAIGVTMLARVSRAEASAKQRRMQIEQIFSRALAVADPGYSRGRNATLKDLLDDTARWIPSAVSDDPRLEANIRARIGETYCKLSLFNSAAPHLEAAWAIRRRLLPEEHPDYLTSLLDLGVLRLWQLRHTEAQDCLRRVLVVQERTLGRDAEDSLRTRNEIGFGLNLRATVVPFASEQEQESFLDEFRRFARESYELAKNRWGPEHPLTLANQLNMANALVYGKSARVTEAEQILDTVYHASRRTLGAEHPNTLQAMGAWGRTLVVLQRNDEALAVLQECVPLDERILGPDHLVTAWAIVQLQRTLRNVGRNEEANALIPRYVVAWIRTYGAENRYVLVLTFDNMHSLAFLRHQPDAAAQFAQARLSDFRDVLHLPPNSPAIAMMRLTLADARLAQQRISEARDLLLEADAVLRQEKPTAAQLWFMHLQLGNYYCNQRRFAEAETELRTAYEGMCQRDLWDVESRRFVGWMMNSLVRLYTDWNEPQKAADWRQKRDAFGPYE